MNAMLEQRSTEWHDWRRQGIGSSDAPAILGLSPWKTAYQVYMEKVGAAQPEPENFAMRRGTQMEEEARSRYIAQTGIVVMPAELVDPVNGVLRASLDGIDMDHRHFVELKCPMAQPTAGIPAHYRAQMLHQAMVVSGVTGIIPTADYAVFVNGKLTIESVQFTGHEISAHKQAMMDWWTAHVVLRIPPEAVHGDVILRDDSAFADAAEAWQAAKIEADRAEEELSRARNALIALAGDRSCSNGSVRLTRSERPGSVDYSKVPELRGIDLDDYRGKPVVSWRITNQ